MMEYLSIKSQREEEAHATAKAKAKRESKGGGGPQLTRPQGVEEKKAAFKALAAKAAADRARHGEG